jgi:hypothetical protein
MGSTKYFLSRAEAAFLVLMCASTSASAQAVSSVCNFTSGPRAGQSIDYTAVGKPPAPAGSSCWDGNNANPSRGTVIAVGNDYADPRGGYVNRGGGGGYSEKAGSAQANYSMHGASNAHPRSTAADTFPHYCCSAVGRLGPYPNNSLPVGGSCYGTDNTGQQQYGSACE